MKEVLHARYLASQQSCNNGEGKSHHQQVNYNLPVAHYRPMVDVETYMVRIDQTQFSRLAAEFHKAVIHLSSQREVTGIPREALDAFQESYASTAFCCRYPYCSKSSAGFASRHLRTQHEIIHLQRVYCKEESCQYSRIGFAKKSALSSHIRKYHNGKEGLPIPPKVRGLKKASRLKDTLVDTLDGRDVSILPRSYTSNQY
jgi:hypothetical protein